MSAGKARHAVPKYRDNYQEHKRALLDLVGYVLLELTEFQKWAETEDHAVEIAESVRIHMHDAIENVYNKMCSVIEQRKSIAAPEPPSDELAYPIDNESGVDESDSGMSNATVMPHKNSTTKSTEHPIKSEDEEPPVSSWKGKGREVNILEHVIGSYIPPAPSMGKGNEPAIPYPLSITRSPGESSRTRLDGSDIPIESKDVVTDSYIRLVREVTKFKASCGSRAADHLNNIARSLQWTAETILTGRLGEPQGAGVSPTSDSEQDTTANRRLCTALPPTMPFQNEGEGTTFVTDSSEYRRTQYKIIIPPRKPKQLPPREMRKRTKLFYDRKYVSNVDDELGAEVKEEEESLQFESISQAFRPIERRTRYNLRSRKQPVAGPSRTRGEPARAEPKRNQNEVSKRTNRERHIEDEEDNSRRNKRRCRENETKKQEGKKLGSNKKRKRDDDNVKEETKTRKRTKRS